MNIAPDAEIVHVSLPEKGFPPGRTLVLHPRLGLLARLSAGAGESGPRLLGAALLDQDECRVLAALLSVFPRLCPYEVALAHLTYAAVDEQAVTRCRERLQLARQEGYWAAEIAGVRAALLSANAKLGCMGLKVCAALDTGYVLVQIHGSPGAREAPAA
jgi:hypothetical protein